VVKWTDIKVAQTKPKKVAVSKVTEKPITKTALTAEYQMPTWISQDIIIPFESQTASVFLIHGNISDLQANFDVGREPEQPYITIRNFLEKFLDEYNIVVFYNLASGLIFPTPEFENRFRIAIGYKEKTEVRKPIRDPRVFDLDNEPQPLPEDPDSCLKLLEHILTTQKNIAVIIDSVHSLVPSDVANLPQNERAIIERFRNWSKSETIRKAKNIVLLFSGELTRVAPDLRQGDNRIRPVYIPKPSAENRAKYLESFQDSNLDVKALTLATQGLGLWQIRELLLQCKATNKVLDLEYVKQRKREILNNEYGDVMELIEPIRGLDNIGGLEHIKDYFRGILSSINSGETRLTPSGIILAGGPGTGKTSIVEALAKEAGFNFVKSKNIRSMYIGQSEERMTRFIQGLRSLAPVVVMNDEADLGESNREGNSDTGVSERLMRAWMELLSDSKIRGKIIVISCTNRLDRIDAALKRSGRSDDRLLIAPPSLEEREVILQIIFKRHQIPCNIRTFKLFAEVTDGFSGADLEKIVLTSFRFAIQSGKKEVDNEILGEAIEDFIPSGSQAEIDRMTLLSVLESSSRRLLPRNLKEILNGIIKRNLVENLDKYINEIKERKIIPIEVGAKSKK